MIHLSMPNEFTYPILTIFTLLVSKNTQLHPVSVMQAF